MANPQAENGHTDISNEILEALARYNLNGEEYRILLVVLRKTWGYHKKEDAISLSQFERLTGMKRPNVVRTIKRLVAKQLLGSSQLATGGVVTYWFQKDYEKWEVVAKQLPVVASSITQVVANSLHTKENSTKEKNLKTFLDSKTEIEEAEEFYLTKKKRKLTGKRLVTFNSFWDAFDYKSGRAEAADAWLDIPTLTEATVEIIIAAARKEAERRPRLKADGKTPKMAQGWLAGRRWEDESYRQPTLVQRKLEVAL